MQTPDQNRPDEDRSEDLIAAAAPARTRFAEPARRPEPASAVAQPGPSLTKAQPGPSLTKAQPGPSLTKDQPLSDPDRVPAPAAGPAERLSAPRVLIAALAVVVLLLSVLTSFLVVRANDDSAAELAASRKDGLAAARSAARVILSYDYRRLDQDFAAGRALTTGKFQGEYDRTTAKLVQDAAPRYQAVVVSDVSNAGVVTASKDRITTIVFVNQQSSSSLMTTPKITQSRLEMGLVKKDGRWLVEQIKAL